MNDRILFMIIDDRVLYLENSTMDHREWYISLGYSEELYETIIRGFIIEGKIVFFKGMNFQYDQEVINSAKKHSREIRLHCNNENLEVYCGIVINSYGSKWEPILKINEEEIEKEIVEDKKENINVKEDAKVEIPQIIELKNDITDESFIKKSTIITAIILVLTIIVKIILFSKNEILHLNNGADLLLTFSQIALLAVTLYGYQKKLSISKYSGLIASILIIFTLDILDIIIGLFYFLFSIDQNYINKIIYFVKNSIQKLNTKKNNKG